MKENKHETASARDNLMGCRYHTPKGKIRIATEQNAITSINAMIAVGIPILKSYADFASYLQLTVLDVQ